MSNKYGISYSYKLKLTAALTESTILTFIRMYSRVMKTSVNRGLKLFYSVSKFIRNVPVFFFLIDVTVRNWEEILGTQISFFIFWQMSDKAPQAKIMLVHAVSVKNLINQKLT